MARRPDLVTIENLILGGMSDGEHMGLRNSAARIVGIDMYSEPGLLRAAPKLAEQDTSSLVAGLDQEIVKIYHATSGTIWTLLFGRTGKVFNRTDAGVYAIRHTLTNVPIHDAAAFPDNGYMYFSSTNKLGRVSMSDLFDDWSSSKNENFGTFDNASDNHPMLLLNNRLYIGDGNKIATVNAAGTFDSDTLVLPKNFVVGCLGSYGTDLMIGGFFRGDYKYTYTYRWNTFSPSYNFEHVIPEIRVFSFIPTDDGFFCQAGTRGSIYAYTGGSWKKFKQLPNKDGYILKNAVSFVNDNPIFGYSNVFSGSVISSSDLHGLYSFGQRDVNYPRVFDLTYPMWVDGESEFVDHKIQITAIEKISETDIMVAWNDVRDGSSTYRVSSLSTAKLCNGAYIDTKILEINGITLTHFKDHFVSYKCIPQNTDLTLSYKRNYADKFKSVNQINDRHRNFIGAQDDIQATTMQYRIKLKTSLLSTPEFKKLHVGLR